MTDIPYERPLSAEAMGVLVNQHEGRLRSLDHWRRNADMKLVGLEGKLEALHDDLQRLSESVDRLNKRVGWFTMSIAGGSLTFAFSVLAATGKL